MISLIENILLALTDAQFDRVLIMIAKAFLAFKEGVQTVWALVAPALGIYLSWKCQQIINNQKENRRALDQNTEVSVKAFEAANSHNEKIAAVVEYAKPKLPPEP
jgi:hypothetical protein